MRVGKTVCKRTHVSIIEGTVTLRRKVAERSECRLTHHGWLIGRRARQQRRTRRCVRPHQLKVLITMCIQ